MKKKSVCRLSSQVLRQNAWEKSWLIEFNQRQGWLFLEGFSTARRLLCVPVFVTFSCFCSRWSALRSWKLSAHMMCHLWMVSLQLFAPTFLINGNAVAPIYWSYPLSDSLLVHVDGWCFAVHIFVASAFSPSLCIWKREKTPFGFRVPQ